MDFLTKRSLSARVATLVPTFVESLTQIFPCSLILMHQTVVDKLAFRGVERPPTFFTDTRISVHFDGIGPLYFCVWREAARDKQIVQITVPPVCNQRWLRKNFLTTFTCMQNWL